MSAPEGLLPLIAVINAQRKGDGVYAQVLRDAQLSVSEVAFDDAFPRLVMWVMGQAATLPKLSGAQRKAWVVDLVGDLVRHLAATGRVAPVATDFLVLLPALVDAVCDVEKGKILINKAKAFKWNCCN